MSYRSRSRSPVRRDSSPGSPRRRSPSPRSYRRYSPRRSPYRRSPSHNRRYSRSPPRYRRYSRSPPRRPYYRRQRSPRVFGSENDRKESSTLFVGNLPYQFRENDVADFFEKSGRLSNITVGINKETGHSKGYAFVTFSDRRDAEEAFNKFQGFVLEGRRLRIDWDVGLEKKQKVRDNRGAQRSPQRRRSPARSPSPARNGSRSPAKSPDRKRSRSPVDGSPKDKKQKLDD